MATLSEDTSGAVYGRWLAERCGDLAQRCKTGTKRRSRRTGQHDSHPFLDGRVDDVIVRGDENMLPGEMEDALLSHHAATDAVVGVPSEQ